jgi:hypothetical protein
MLLPLMWLPSLRLDLYYYNLTASPQHSLHLENGGNIFFRNVTWWRNEEDRTVNNHRSENFTAYNKDLLKSAFINVSEESSVSIFREEK